MKTLSQPEQLFDVRLADRHINSGKITKKELDQYVRQLPDAAENMEVVPREMIFDEVAEQEESTPQPE